MDIVSVTRSNPSLICLLWRSCLSFTFKEFNYFIESEAKICFLSVSFSVPVSMPMFLPLFVCVLYGIGSTLFKKIHWFNFHYSLIQEMFLYFWLLDAVTLNYICYFSFFLKETCSVQKTGELYTFLRIIQVCEIVYKWFKNRKW